MFQFGEILTLGIGIVVLAVLGLRWRRLWGSPTQRPFILPLALMAASWVFTVVEGITPEHAQQATLILYSESAGRGADPPWTQFCNLLEHLTATAAAVALLVAVLKARLPRQRAA